MHDPVHCCYNVLMGKEEAGGEICWGCLSAGAIGYLLLNYYYTPHNSQYMTVVYLSMQSFCSLISWHADHNCTSSSDAQGVNFHLGLQEQLSVCNFRISLLSSY